jgi:hypothetical protein
MIQNRPSGSDSGPVPGDLGLETGLLAPKLR